MKKEIKHFTFIGPDAWCNFNPKSQNSSSRYRELHNQAHALMQAKKQMKKEIKHFTFIWPAAWCSFNPEFQNSSSRYQELHNQAQAMMQAKIKMKKFKLPLPRAS
jgi:chaperonin cofactor prefoldin